jgi:hypothetical protein
VDHAANVARMERSVIRESQKPVNPRLRGACPELAEGLHPDYRLLSLLRQSAWPEAATPDFDREEPPLVIEQQLSMLLGLDFDIGKALSHQ